MSTIWFSAFVPQQLTEILYIGLIFILNIPNPWILFLPGFDKWITLPDLHRQFDVPWESIQNAREGFLTEEGYYTNLFQSFNTQPSLPAGVCSGQTKQGCTSAKPMRRRAGGTGPVSQRLNNDTHSKRATCIHLYCRWIIKQWIQRKQGCNKIH